MKESVKKDEIHFSIQYHYQTILREANYKELI